MTRNEMHLAITQGINGADSDSGFYFEPEQLDLFINKMIDRFIKQRYYAQSNAKQRGFEMNQKRLADLQSLVKTSTITMTAGVGKYTYTLSGTTGYYLFVRLGTNVVKNGVSYPLKPCRVVENEDLDFIQANPFTATIMYSPIATISDGSIKVYNDGTFTTPTCELTYITKPAVVSSSINCDLPVHTHQEIVDMVITHIRKVTEDPAYQLEVADENRTE